jgi:hypothetical protein
MQGRSYRRLLSNFYVSEIYEGLYLYTSVVILRDGVHPRT